MWSNLSNSFFKKFLGHPKPSSNARRTGAEFMNKPKKLTEELYAVAYHAGVAAMESDGRTINPELKKPDLKRGTLYQKPTAPAKIERMKALRSGGCGFHGLGWRGMSHAMRAKISREYRPQTNRVSAT